MMFSHTAISTFNELELEVYHYVMKHREAAGYMTIRELATAAGVSTTTVLRFCRKLGCEGYAEFRVRLRMEQDALAPEILPSGAGEMVRFFTSVNTPAFEKLLDDAATLIASAPRIIFVGTGGSGTLAKYGARYFGNLGISSQHIDDPWFPVTQGLAEGTLAILLSVSGETEAILHLASQFSKFEAQILSVTSHEHSSLAKLADFNISWHLAPERLAEGYDITTQIPVMYIIESLGRRLVKPRL
ncbi:transcriptional regulator [Salmonella enterica subsp. enterica serovar Choleraesuis]|nr:transcriptional regulator [Salmonella enterica subsp. enterica serovar Choleraesuis]